MRADIANDAFAFSILNDRVNATKQALFFSYFTEYFKISLNYTATKPRFGFFIHQFFPLTASFFWGFSSLPPFSRQGTELI